MVSGQDAIRRAADRLRAIHAILPTPFLDDLSLDFAGFARNIEAILARGLQGVLVGGGYGEFPSLFTEERCHLIREAVRTVAGRVPVIACTAHSSTLEALKLTRAAEEAGADAAMLTPPYVTEVKEADVERHFAFIASRVAIPLILYNTPSTGVVLTPALIARLAEIPTVVGIKQGVVDASEMAAVVEVVEERLTVLCGSDTVMVAGLAVGMEGVTSTNASAFPDLIVAAYRAAREGDWEEARRLHRRWARYRAFARRVGQPATVKAAMDLTGLVGGACRPPLQALGAAEREELRAVLEGIGMVGFGAGSGA
jgi:4-hydroxy-tetrahydrodipicolinate synthase